METLLYRVRFFRWRRKKKMICWANIERNSSKRNSCNKKRRKFLLILKALEQHKRRGGGEKWMKFPTTRKLTTAPQQFDDWLCRSDSEVLEEKIFINPRFTINHSSLKSFAVDTASHQFLHHWHTIPSACKWLYEFRNGTNRFYSFYSFMQCREIRLIAPWATRVPTSGSIVWIMI